MILLNAVQMSVYYQQTNPITRSKDYVVGVLELFIISHDLTQQMFSICPVFI